MESVLTKNQKIKKTKLYKENGTDCMIELTIRYDDQCGNGHNSFSMTANGYEKTRSGKWIDTFGGCCHDEIKKRFPEYSKYIKWHFMNSDGPTHYIANTLYHAGDRDCHGLKAGEVRGYAYGVKFNGVPIIHETKKAFWDFLKERIGTGDFQCVSFAHPKDPKMYSPNWSLVGFGDGWYKCPFHNETEARQFCEAVNTCEVDFVKYADSWGKGKEREFDAARSSAIWPEATEEELSSDNLEQLLIDRLPSLIEDFKKDLEELGLTY